MQRQDYVMAWLYVQTAPNFSIAMLCGTVNMELCGERGLIPWP
jgi:hypothetical protein